MNLHQFRFVQEAARHDLNLTEAARALHTSQPGVSKAIIELEDQMKYYTALGKADHGDLNYMVQMICEAVLKGRQFLDEKR